MLKSLVVWMLSLIVLLVFYSYKILFLVYIFLLINLIFIFVERKWKYENIDYLYVK